ncbi:conjugal transfer protein TraO [Polluticaenibacter yanchengensis]|uniref:Conjugal transfer protein TraO n=1 Tax=Polluticaenibacter yanchengensis TaxID=3014562 RepID=A0ABT4UFH4_9BACT|nr:conjugal transfer protein TraO [Chitinophagaceae bacterium LY-5]
MNRIILIIVMVLACIYTQAQRMLPGQKGLEISTGILAASEIDQHYFINLSLTINGKSKGYWILGTEYTHQSADHKILQIPLETYTAEGGYSLRMIANPRKSINLNAAVLCIAGYETINRGRETLPDGAVIQNKEGFIYGAGGRLSLETYLGDKFTIVFQGKVKILWGTSRDSFRPGAGLGLRYNF